MDVYLAPIEIGRHIVINNVNFESRKDELTTDSYPALDSLASFMLINKTLEIKITGHTDDIGSVNENQKLSERRAIRVKEYLIIKGVAENRIQSEGLGMSSPLLPNDSDVNRSKNRRVEFTILKN